MCIAPWASCHEGVHGKQSWPIECLGVTYEMTVTELIAGIQTDKVTMWVERGSCDIAGFLGRPSAKLASFIRAAKGLMAEEMGRFAREAAFSHRALAQAGTAEAQP